MTADFTDSKFQRNDIVKLVKEHEKYNFHDRLMVVENYTKLDNETVANGLSLGKKIVVTEGGYYKEDELELVYRRNNNDNSK